MSSPTNGQASATPAAPTPGQSIGTKLKLFTKGRGRPSLYSASDINKLVTVLNAFLNFSIKRGATDQAILSDANFVLQLAYDTGGAGAVGMYQLQSVQGDYVTLFTWDGTTLGSTAVLAAKEYKLRNSLTGESEPGGAATYAYGSGPDGNNVQRTKSQGGNSETQLVVPLWVVGEVVYAVNCTTGVVVDGVDVGNLLIRTGAWARTKLPPTAGPNAAPHVLI